MMPLSMLSVGSTDTIKKITGKDEVRRFLSSLDRSLANRIMV